MDYWRSSSNIQSRLNAGVIEEGGGTVQPNAEDSELVVS